MTKMTNVCTCIDSIYFDEGLNVDYLMNSIFDQREKIVGKR